MKNTFLKDSILTGVVILLDISWFLLMLEGRKTTMGAILIAIIIPILILGGHLLMSFLLSHKEQNYDEKSVSSFGVKLGWFTTISWILFMLFFYFVPSLPEQLNLNESYLIGFLGIGFYYGCILAYLILLIIQLFKYVKLSLTN